ncbi:Wiskott-Aldrich syndrome protein family member 3 [Halotydeus destructor]|nr:Wiskott-Aldrich syndrome protein family member 3 [Halotydeus destructor]KAI1291029.1 Wiskott-Aldrich syndrome protein family member 3 [Halotydeus destructor]
MPLEQRVVDPITVSRGTLPVDAHGNLAINIPNELECVTNGTLANVIRQLSSLSNFAEDLFGGILTEATRLIARSTQLQGRIDRLAVKVTQLDSTVEEVSLHDIHLRKPFKSYSSYDQQVVSRLTIPVSLKEQLEVCDKPPPLQKLNSYRDDGKDGLTFYTDANYFFELWRQDMLKETEREKSNKKGANKGPARGQNGPISGEKSRNRKPRQPVNSKDKYRQMAAQQEFLPMQDTGKGMQYVDSNGYYSSGYSTMQPNRPNSLEINHYVIDNGHYRQTGAQMQQPIYSHSGHVDQQGNAVQQRGNGHVQQHNIQRHHSLTSPLPNHSMAVSQGNNMASVHSGSYAQMTPQDVSTSHMIGNQSQGTPTRRSGSVGPTNRPSQPPPAPPSNPTSSNSSGQGTPTVGTPSRSRGPSVTRDILPPPPPPPPPGMPGGVGMPSMVNGNHEEHDLPLPPMPNQGIGNSAPKASHIPAQPMMPSAAAAPPPPPPPPPSGTGDTTTSVRRQAPTFADQILQGQKQLQPAKMSTKDKVLQHVNQQHVDAQTGLLAAIREGIKLRRVEDTKQKEVEKAAPCNDVASILARRVAMELSDSESDEDGASGSDAWDDESEC